MSITFEINEYSEKISSYIDEIQTLKYELARKDSKLAKKESQYEILTFQNKQLNDEIAKMTEKSNSTSMANFARLADMKSELTHTKNENSHLSREIEKLNDNLKAVIYRENEFVKLNIQIEKLTKQNINLKDDLNVEKSETLYKDWKRRLDEQSNEVPSNRLSSTVAVAVNVMKTLRSYKTLHSDEINEEERNERELWEARWKLKI